MITVSGKCEVSRRIKIQYTDKSTGKSAEFERVESVFVIGAGDATDMLILSSHEADGTLEPGKRYRLGIVEYSEATRRARVNRGSITPEPAK